MDGAQAIDRKLLAGAAASHQLVYPNRPDAVHLSSRTAP
ncbi:hypothetical protein ACVWZX_003957 [Deinococcus sp. UYEF24]